MVDTSFIAEDSTEIYNNDLYDFRKYRLWFYWREKGWIIQKRNFSIQLLFKKHN